MHKLESRYIVSILNYHTSVTSIKKLICHSPIRCATAELHLQRRYDDSVTSKYKIQIKKQSIFSFSEK